METAQKTPQTLQDIEQKLQELQKDQEGGTTAEIADVLSLIEKYELTDEVKALLDKKIASQKSELLYTLLRVPSSIQKPIEWSTRIENAQKKVDLLIKHINTLIQNINNLSQEEYVLSLDQKLVGYDKEETINLLKDISTYVGDAAKIRKEALLKGSVEFYKFIITEITPERKKDKITKLEEDKRKLNEIKELIVNAKPDSDLYKKLLIPQIKHISSYEEELLRGYSKLCTKLTPKSIANKIDTGKLYHAPEGFYDEINKYFEQIHPVNSTSTIPDGVDTDTIRYINMSEKQIPQNNIAGPLHIAEIEYLPVQYIMFDSTSYPNPQYEEAQKIKEKFDTKK